VRKRESACPTGAKVKVRHHAEQANSRALW
jgi:hypothetical protein